MENNITNKYKHKKGVTFQQRRDNTNRGNWVAEIGGGKHKKRTKNFAVRKYGNDEALLMAYYQRLIFEVEENKRSEDYGYYCYSLLEEITDFYGYDIDKRYNCIKDIYEIVITNDDDTFIYDTEEDGLKDWYVTLVESDKCAINEKVDMYWEKERNFIRKIIDYTTSNK